MKERFELTPHCNSKFSSNNTNILSRILNTLAAGINEVFRLPKYLVVILDDDLIQYLNYDGYGCATCYGEWIEFLVEGFKDLFQDAKDKLPKKAVKDSFPWTYWVTAPRHKFFRNNSAHTKFNNTLEATIKSQPNMRLIKLKEIWDFENMNLVEQHSGRISFEGLSTYWLSIDAAVKFNVNKHELFLAKKPVVKKQESHKVTSTHWRNKHDSRDKMPEFFGNNRDRFHWSSKSHQHKTSTRRLPHPDHYKF